MGKRKASHFPVCSKQVCRDCRRRPVCGPIENNGGCDGNQPIAAAVVFGIALEIVMPVCYDGFNESMGETYVKLLTNALVKYISGLLLVGLLLFWPAGTLRYPNGWLFAGILFLPMLALGVILYLKAPALLEKRLEAKEGEAAQRSVVAVSGLAFTVGFILAGLDYRFDWSNMQLWISALAAFLFLFSYGLYAEVMRENAYLSRTIKVETNQRVVDTGLYGIVRHPMYAATILMFLSIPLILGSWYALIAFGIYPVLISVRIDNEEKVLEKELAGYTEYKKKVKYRILPFIW